MAKVSLQILGSLEFSVRVSKLVCSIQVLVRALVLESNLLVPLSSRLTVATFVAIPKTRNWFLSDVEV